MPSWQRRAGWRGSWRRWILSLVIVMSACLVSGKVWADTMEISQIPLGGVISINGRKFIKISVNNDFVAADFCRNGGTYDPNLKKCVITFGCSNPTGTMQSWTGCAALATPTGTNYTQGPCLIDERDNKTYEIRKFADGNCWMTTNLAYGGVDRNNGVDGCKKTTYCGMGYNADGTCITNSASSIPIVNKIAPGLYGDCRYPYDSTATPDTYKYGYLYNWQAAVQDVNAYYNNVYQPPQPTQGICPDGWYLPTGGPNGQFQALHTAVGLSDDNFWQPGKSWNGVFSGVSAYQYGGFFALEFQDSGGYHPDNGGYYSSSTQGSNYTVVGLAFDSSSVASRITRNKRCGLAVRCLKTP